MALRKVIHVDMDAFYASVEQRDRPELRGKPVVVGGAPNSRGVVCAASYEARAFGVHSAMPAAQAYRLCPQATFLRPEFARYKEVSRQIHEVFRSYTSHVEPLSLDEAYLDVTQNSLGTPSATRVAQAIRADILRTTQLTASAGVASNKFLAKVASDMDKPDGLVVIPPERVASVLAELPVRRIPGVGKVGEQRCKRHGIETCGDFLRHSRDELAQWFGSAGPAYLRLAQGVDPRPVVSSRERKSCSVENTFARDVTDVGRVRAILADVATELEGRLRRAETCGKTVVLKVKYGDFTQITRSRTLGAPICAQADLLAAGLALLEDTEAGRRPIRLLGLGVAHLGEERQLLFPFMRLASTRG